MITGHQEWGRDSAVLSYIMRNAIMLYMRLFIEVCCRHFDGRGRGVTLELWFLQLLGRRSRTCGTGSE